MAEKNNATCSICGEKYYVCSSCRDSIKAHPWKTYTDTSEHYKVFQIVRGFYNGVYTKDEAKDKLNNVDLSDLENFVPHIKKIVKDILREPVVKPVRESKVVADKIEDEKDATVNDTHVEDVLNIEKQVVYRKKNYKVEAE